MKFKHRESTSLLTGGLLRKPEWGGFPTVLKNHHNHATSLSDRAKRGSGDWWFLTAHEFWRDVETLGSFTFYIAVIARSLIGLGGAFFWELIAALIVSQALLRTAGRILKQKISSHTANAGVLLIIIAGYYKSMGFTLFLAALLALTCIGHQKLRRHSWQEVLIGLAIGLLTGFAAWTTIPRVL